MEPVKIALGIEYLGTDYFGWQSQDGMRCVQSEIEKALSQVADHPIKTICAGRTDTGVHARGQVVHFETTAKRDERSWLLGLNTLLPADTSVYWVRQVGNDFHARFSAVSRTYQYHIYNRLTRNAVYLNRATWIYHPLNAELMQQASQFLLGKHDFNALRSSQCQSHKAIRTIHSISVQRDDNWIILKVKANAFLHHMVRNIVGSLLKVGKGECEPEWMQAILHKKDRTLAGPTAPPDGLYLHSVEYPEKFSLPTLPSQVRL
ncbi:MAG: tRNA pseudouridine(38-40) synthase TruA [Gammaproteobacteria bacterium]|nr:tRNA pseudouridine(38-40) synthase TruA [Gammaproteobacteria bacterium]NNC96947.1 tRNA pseudouridine(38-40) synthase TruA [Gammaproteobacteria bacterium]NNM14583.1 tRNA pseudouridine(38-40) synthase TruA [Gammaproteobacteria bacterium]